MPPRKRKASTAAEQPAPSQTRATRAAEAIATDAPAPKRTKTTATKTKATENKDASDAPKTRGRPPGKKIDAVAKAAPVDDAPKKRGRPSKPITDPVPVSTTPKKRGRPSKPEAAATDVDQDAIAAPPKKGRGRPAKVQDDIPGATAAPAKKGRGRPKAEAVDVIEPDAPRKRGRPTKASAIASEQTDDAAPKKRGRPAGVKAEKEETPKKAERGPAKAKPEKAAVEKPAAKKRGRPALEQDPVDEPVPKRARGRPSIVAEETVEDEDAAPEDTEAPQDAEVKGKGKAKAPTAKKSKSKAAKANSSDKTAEAAASPKKSSSPTKSQTYPDPEYDEKPVHGRGYWLMKAEPESRVETTSSGKQVDIKFTIDDLAAKDVEPWDGIRNHMAQKNLRAMEVGDLCFFSESNCKVPGIVGIMQVVATAQPDPCQFDPDSPYYDPKSSPEKPRWDMVMVKFRRKFATKIPHTTLRQYSDGPGQGPLGNLQLFRLSRLSVSQVEPDEWALIMKIVAEAEAGADGEEAAASGSKPSPKKATPKASAKALSKTPSRKSPQKKSVTTQTPDETAPATGRRSARQSTSAKQEDTPTAVTNGDVKSAKKTPAAKGAAAKVATPATEPKPATKKTPATQKKAANAAPKTEPRKRTQRAVASPAPIKAAARRSVTPAARGKRSPSKLSTSGKVADGITNGEDTNTAGEQIQISVQEPTELTFGTSAEDANSNFDVRDVTNESVNSVDVHGDQPVVTSPSLTNAVLPSTEEADADMTMGDASFASLMEDRAATPNNADLLDVDDQMVDGDEGRKSFLGRIGEGIYNAVTSPSRAVGRALSGTPKPESRPGSRAGEPATSDGQLKEPLPVTMEEVTDVEL